MGQNISLQGNEAAAQGAILADCEAFFGYPITPTNEVIEFCSREFPKRGKAFLQSTSETDSINQVIGAATVGARAFTATSGPGWGLMQEGMSHMVGAQLPGVVYLCQRGGPGGGTIRHGQFDYMSACWGGGQGGYRVIVLAPSSVRQTVEYMQLAFYLADKYRNPVIVLSDAVIGQIVEPVDLEAIGHIDFGPLPPKEHWATIGFNHREDRKRRWIASSSVHNTSITPPLRNMGDYYQMYHDKWQAITEHEVRYEDCRVDDADLILVAFGYTSRVSREVMNWARADGLRVGMFRPITLAPFPYEHLASVSHRGMPILVVEDNLGQMIVDVKLATQGRNSLFHVGCLQRHAREATGLIQPETVFTEVKRILGGGERR